MIRHSPVKHADLRINRKITFVILNNTQVKVVWKPFGYNKLLLAIFGLFFDGARGMLVGFIIGSILDGEVIFKEQPKKVIDWRVSYLMLGAFVLQSPGVGSRVSSAHIKNTISNFFGEAYATSRMAFMYELLKQRIQVAQICNHMRTEASIEERKKCLRYLFELAEIEGVETHQLHHSINYVAARFDVEFNDVQDIYRAFLNSRRTKQEYKKEEKKTYTNAGNSTSDALLFGKLNLTPSATEKQVRKAYYALAKKYHPDSNPNAGPTEKKQLEAKLREVIEAYEAICEKRGW